MTTRAEKPPIGPDTKLCMSLAARPGKFGTRFHNHLYERLGLDFVYKAFTTTDLKAAIGGVRALGIRGCAISMPFKEEVIPLIDGLMGSAAAIDSVNTIVNDDGRLTGYNTDYSAIVALLDRAGIDPATPFPMRGSGGMAKAVAAALRDRGQKTGSIIARNEATGRPLAELYGFSWAAGDNGLAAPVIINATPLGMQGSELGLTGFTSCGKSESIGAPDSEPASWTSRPRARSRRGCGFFWTTFPGSRTDGVQKMWLTR